LRCSLRPARRTTAEWQRVGNQIDATFIFAGADFGPVAHRIIVKEVSQMPPPPPIISVTHVRADENER
jgi:hypothetical protein